MAVSKMGSQRKLALALGIEPMSVTYWMKKGIVPANRVLDVEKVTGISRTELNPVIYPKN